MLARAGMAGGRAVISDIFLKKPLSRELKMAPNLYGT